MAFGSMACRERRSMVHGPRGTKDKGKEGFDLNTGPWLSVTVFITSAVGEKIGRNWRGMVRICVTVFGTSPHHTEFSRTWLLGSGRLVRISAHRIAQLFSGLWLEDKGAYFRSICQCPQRLYTTFNSCKGRGIDVRPSQTNRPMKGM